MAITLAILLLVSTFGTLRAVDDLPCVPRTAYVNTDPLSIYHYMPYVVKLQRCAGGRLNPLVYKCAPTSVDKSDIHVVRPSDRTSANLTVEEHTSCTETCKFNATHCNRFSTWNAHTCKCDCTWDGSCKAPKVWSASSCDCVCPMVQRDCGVRKIWDNSNCSCQCSGKKIAKCARRNKPIDPNTCHCIDPPMMQKNCRRKTRVWSKKEIRLACLVEALFCIVMLSLFHMCCHRYIQLKCVKCSWGAAGEVEEEVRGSRPFRMTVHPQGRERMRSLKRVFSTRNGETTGELLLLDHCDRARPANPQQNGVVTNVVEGNQQKVGSVSKDANEPGDQKKIENGNVSKTEDEQRNEHNLKNEEGSKTNEEKSSLDENGSVSNASNDQIRRLEQASEHKEQEKLESEHKRVSEASDEQYVEISQTGNCQNVENENGSKLGENQVSQQEVEKVGDVNRELPSKEDQTLEGEYDIVENENGESDTLVYPKKKIAMSKIKD